MNIQHRAANDALGNTNHGALVKISGFKVKQDRRHHQHNGHVWWDDDDSEWNWMWNWRKEK